MRPALPAILVLACCSKPVPVTAVEGESKPIAAAPLPAGKHRFVISTSHEISCSQSFESHGVHVSYELAIEATGKATLKIDGASSTVFGPSDAKFSAGSKVEHASKPIAELWSGTAKTIGSSVQLELASDKSTWKLWCDSKKVEAKLPYAEGVDANASRVVEVLSCTPTRHVAEEDDKQIGALLFAPLPGLQSSVHDYGFGGEHAELRLLRE